LAADNNKEKFLEELKIQYEKEFELKNSLETKANYSLASSGVIVGLLFTFAANLFNIFKNLPALPYISISLLIGVGLFIIAIFFSVQVSRIKQYHYATLHKYFFKNEGVFNEGTKSEYKYMKLDDFLDDRIDTYLVANKINFEHNEDKARNVSRMHWLFFFGIISIIVTILLFSISVLYKG